MPKSRTKIKPNRNQHLPAYVVRTARMCVRIIAHNCRAQHSTEKFW